jgi:hypothetical protein
LLLVEGSVGRATDRWAPRSSLVQMWPLVLCTAPISRSWLSSLLPFRFELNALWNVGKRGISSAWTLVKMLVHGDLLYLRGEILLLLGGQPWAGIARGFPLMLVIESRVQVRPADLTGPLRFVERLAVTSNYDAIAWMMMMIWFLWGSNTYIATAAQPWMMLSRSILQGQPVGIVSLRTQDLGFRVLNDWLRMSRGSTWNLTLRQLQRLLVLLDQKLKLSWVQNGWIDVHLC